MSGWGFLVPAFFAGLFLAFGISGVGAGMYIGSAVQGAIVVVGIGIAIGRAIALAERAASGDEHE